MSSSKLDRYQLVSISIISEELQKVTQFYEKFLGMQFGYNLSDTRPSFHTIISSGVQLVVSKMDNSKQKGIMFHFRVDSLENAKKRATAAGGKVKLAEDYPMMISEKVFSLFEEHHKDLRPNTKMGKFSILEDPEGNVFGVIQFEPWAESIFRPGNITLAESESLQAGIEIGKKLQTLIK